MEIEQIIKQCDAVIEDKRYSRHTFVSNIDSINPSLIGLAAWAVQKYFQVFVQNRIFSAIHGNTNHVEIRQFMMEQLIAEETDMTCGTDTHYGLMKRFALSCGAEESDFDLSNMCSEVKVYLDSLLGICKREHPVIALLTIYAIESQSGESAGKLNQWIAANHDLSDYDREWFILHSEEEDDHAEGGLALVKKFHQEVEDFDSKALGAVNGICDAWLTLHDKYLSLLSEKPASHLKPDVKPSTGGVEYA